MSSRYASDRSGRPLRGATWFAGGLSGLFWGGVLWINAVSMSEAFRHGAPYYARAAYPGLMAASLPMLALVDTAALLCRIAIYRWLRPRSSGASAPTRG